MKLHHLDQRSILETSPMWLDLSVFFNIANSFATTWTIGMCLIWLIWICVYCRSASMITWYLLATIIWTLLLVCMCCWIKTVLFSSYYVIISCPQIININTLLYYLIIKYLFEASCSHLFLNMPCFSGHSR